MNKECLDCDQNCSHLVLKLSNDGDKCFTGKENHDKFVNPENKQLIETDENQIDSNYVENKIEISNVDRVRSEWSNRIEFILCCIGTAVGLGNIWRFPYLCYKNGGGAFLVPYTITLCLLGLPLFFMELALGQFSSMGPIGLWSISPLFKGIGYGMVFISGLTCIYYNVIIAQCIYYFGVSFTSSLPWENCNNTWNNRSLCYDGINTSNLGFPRISASEEYYDNYVLNISRGIEDFGLPQWKICLCFFVAWIIVILILLKGMNYIGKVSYITALFPYVILTILLIRGLLLPGAWTGILFYLKPNFSYLKYPDVWIEAATQIFFSLNLCNGSLITISSFNKFKNNCLRDAVLVAVINCATSIFAGFVIFSNLGFMALSNNVSITDVVKGGPGLAFKVYPEALSKMPLSPLWSVLFFLMMIILGIGSQIALVQAVLVGFQDELTKKFLKSDKLIILYRVGMCLIMLAIGIPMTCRGGMYLLEIFDGVVGGPAVLVIAISEVLVVSYAYGIERFRKDIKIMIKYKPNKFWKYTWMVISPIILFAMLISSIVYSFLKERKTSFCSTILHIILTIIPIVLLAILFIVVYCRHGGWLLFAELKKPITAWGPKHKHHNEEYHKSIKKKKDEIVDFFQSKEKLAEKFLQKSSSENKSSKNDNEKENKLLTASQPILASEYC